MLNKKQIWLFLFIYAVLRIFSYFFQPETPLYGGHFVNTAISILVLISIIYLLYKKDERGWYIIALEMILGGAGGYLAVGGISLRTLFLISSLIIYTGQKIFDIRYWILNKKKINLNNINNIIFLLVIWGIFSGIHGYLNNHNISLIIADTIPYLFFLYYFPLRELLRLEKFKQIAFNALVATIIGNFLLIIITFIGYSYGWLALQDSYYHWYRDVALGKITELPFHFYRLVLNEHLLLVPVLLFFLYQIIAKKSKTLLFTLYSLLLLIILSLNLTRIYLVALLVGVLFLFNLQNWKRWLVVSIFSGLFFLFSFTTIHLVASRGQSLGWEIFGVRLQSIVSPKIEESSFSRMLLLPKIIEKIKKNPLLGSGLGDTVTVYSPVFKKEITTPHFDWGYLEIIAEMGIVGIVIWIFNIGYLILRILRNVDLPKQFYFASIVALLFLNITSPALFHVLGIIIFIYLVSAVSSNITNENVANL